MKEIADFISRLKDEKREMQRKRKFFHEHNFKNEFAVINEKIKILEVVTYELESVATGQKKGIDAKLDFE